MLYTKRKNITDSLFNRDFNCKREKKKKLNPATTNALSFFVAPYSNYTLWFF